jgi:hypothetical protein
MYKPKYSYFHGNLLLKVSYVVNVGEIIVQFLIM